MAHFLVEIVLHRRQRDAAVVVAAVLRVVGTAVHGLKKILGEQPVPVPVVPVRQFGGAGSRDPGQAAGTACGKGARRARHHRRIAEQLAAGAAARKTGVEQHRDRAGADLLQVGLEQFQRKPGLAHGARVGIDRQQVGLAVLQARDAVPGVVDEHVRSAAVPHVAGQFSIGVIGRAEHAEQVALGRVRQENDIVLGVAEHVDDVVLDRLRIAVGVFDFRDVLVLIRLVADDDGDTVRIAHLRLAGGRAGRQHYQGCRHQQERTHLSLRSLLGTISSPPPGCGRSGTQDTSAQCNRQRRNSARRPTAPPATRGRSNCLATSPACCG